MTWEQLRVAAECAYGCGVISRGAWCVVGRSARARARHGRRFIVCRDCARIRYRLLPPAVPDRRAEARDGKALALGRDE